MVVGPEQLVSELGPPARDYVEAVDICMSLVEYQADVNISRLVAE